MIAPLLVYLLEYFDQMGGQRVFMFDECWKFLESVGDYIEEKARTIRKEESALIGISQNISDWEKSTSGQAFIGCCYHKFIFRQTIKESEYISDDDKLKIASCISVKGQYSELFYKSEISKKVLRYYQTPFEYHLFTSHKPDNTKMDNFFKTLGPDQIFKDSFDLYVEKFS